MDRVTTSSTPMRKTLSDVLLEGKLVDEEQLQRLARRSRREHVGILVALLEEGLAGEAQVLELVERHLGVARLDPAALVVEAEAVREVTYELAVAHCLLPLSVDRQGARRVVRLAMADPLDREAIEEIESSTGCRVDPVLAAPADLGPAIEKAYRGLVTKMIPRGAGQREMPAETTKPQHRLEDLAPVEARLQALCQLLIERGVITVEDYQEALGRVIGEEGQE